MNEKLFIPKPNDVVRLGPWTGVVLDVFHCETSVSHSIKINFVKNVFKQQPPELHILEDMVDVLLAPATSDELKTEIAWYESRIQKQVTALRANIAAEKVTATSD